MPVDFRRQSWITWGIFLGSVLVFGLAHYWVVGRINFSVADILNQRDLIKQGSTLTETLANLKREKQLAEVYQQDLNRLVATRDQLIVSFSRWLSSEATLYRAGVDFSFQGGETQASEESLGYAGFAIKLTGALSDLVSLSKYLEREANQFIMNFDGFDISQGSGGYHLSLNGRVFFR